MKKHSACRLYHSRIRKLMCALLPYPVQMQFGENILIKIVNKFCNFFFVSGHWYHNSISKETKAIASKMKIKHGLDSLVLVTKTSELHPRTHEGGNKGLQESTVASNAAAHELVNAHSCCRLLSTMEAHFICRHQPKFQTHNFSNKTTVCIWEIYNEPTVAQDITLLLSI